MVKKAISKKTGRGSEQFQLRLPDGMRKQLAEVAGREGRTMNAVIVVALVRYFENERQSAALRAQIQAPGQGSTDTKGLEDLVVRLDQKLTELIKKADTSELVELIKQKIK
jgi:predicted transcriptional regulator